MTSTMHQIPSGASLHRLALDTAARCGVDVEAITGDVVNTSPVNGQRLADLGWVDGSAVDETVSRARDAFLQWRTVPAPVRGALVKRLGELLAVHKDDVATLISLEVGKITSEARGEVQEMIDICDFAVGLSRQLYGRTMTSERPGHRLMETWHPLGVVGVISAFNFPAAVWSWNTAIALVCGDPVIWKPSELAPLTALASQAILARAIADCGAPAHLGQVLIGGADVGQALVEHAGVALLSATGSTRMGRAVGPRVADRFGRSLLELGGNNAAVVSRSADLDLTTRGVVFSAAGTAGQRCTTMRRVIAHSSIVDELTDRLVSAYDRLPIGNPMEEGTLVGPLIGRTAYESMQQAIEQAGSEGGKLVAGGGRALEEEAPDAFYARPSIVRIDQQTPVVERETLRTAALRAALRRLRRGDRVEQRGPAGPVVERVHLGPGRGRALRLRRGLRLRHRQRQHRHVGCRDRRGLRRREGDRRRPRVRLRRLARLHAPRHQHRELLRGAPARPGRRLHRLMGTD